MKKSILIAFACMVSCFVASAQSQKVIKKEFEKFSTVKVEDNFIVKFYNSEKYFVNIKVDERIASHVQAYEKANTLYLILDEKGYTKELKKELKQKGAAQPVLEAEIHMPAVESLILTDKATVLHSDVLTASNFTLTASSNVKIHQLKVSCEDADLNVSRNVELTADMTVKDKLSLKTANSSKVVLAQKGGKTVLDLDGSSFLEMKAEVEALEVHASSGADSHISGTAESLVVDVSGMSMTDVETLLVKEAYITQTGSSKCYSNVTDKLTVNLTGGSMLTFMNEPSIVVERIVNSTFIKSDDPKRK